MMLKIKHLVHLSHNPANIEPIRHESRVVFSSYMSYDSKWCSYIYMYKCCSNLV